MLKDKKVLQVGLGILGGGVATAKWLLENGAKLTITDLKSKEYLKSSLLALSEYKDKIKFVLGRHDKADFLENEIIVLNPAVPSNNEFVELARRDGKTIENELTFFYKFSKCKESIAISGTRGKTTTTNWISQILRTADKDTVVLGNDPEKPLLSEIAKCGSETIAVIEEPSFLLEIIGGSNKASHIAVLTNIYPDHIDRYKSIEKYALTKANIFKNQRENDLLILNHDNEWAKFFLELKPISKVLFFSLNILPPGFPGAYVSPEMDFVLCLDDEEKKVMNLDMFVRIWGMHNVSNFISASLAAYLAGADLESIKNSAESLVGVKFRQEKIYEDSSLVVYNDSASTSPEAGVSALERFKNEENLILITGGTDKQLEFAGLSEVIKKVVRPENLVLLSGSATEKMKEGFEMEMGSEFGSLEECVYKAMEIATKHSGKSIIIFSPASKSFEKFKNEFDRGDRFNKLISDIIKK